MGVATVPGRVLLLGNTGKLGRALEAAFRGAGEVIGRNSGDFDAATPGAGAALVAEVAPALVINAVAFQGLDACWAQPERALRINALFPRELACAAEQAGAAMIHFSTECVFGGTPGGGPYRETDMPAPLNVYGLSKFGGEAMVRAHVKRHYVVRLPMLFGEDPRAQQFVERMVMRARRGDPVTVATDVVTSPTYVVDAAACVRGLWQDERPWGTYHVTNAGAASLHTFMRELLVGLGLEGVLRAASHEDFPQRDTKNTNTPLTSVLLPPLRPWPEAVAAFVAVLKRGI